MRLSRGCRARIEGLRSRTDLNGQVCDVLLAPSGERCTVQCDGGEEQFKLKPENLVVIAGWPLETLSLAELNSVADNVD